MILALLSPFLPVLAVGLFWAVAVRRPLAVARARRRLSRP